MTRSTGCINCRYLNRTVYEDDPDAKYYSDSGSFQQDFEIHYKVKDNDMVTIKDRVNLDHFGVYTNVFYSKTASWVGNSGLYEFEDIEPDYFWWPLITLGIIGLAVIFVRTSYVCYKDKKAKKQKELELEKELMNNQMKNKLLDNNDKGNKSTVKVTDTKEAKPVVVKERLHCLDTFRGLTMFGMVFVNYQGGNYEFFNHSLWNGMTFADCIFPFFMWIMGVSSAYSMKREYTVDKKTSINRILVRSLKLFLLGLLVNQNWDMTHFRIMGVLQRFAISYLFNSL